MIPYVDRDLLKTFATVFAFLLLFVQVGIFVSFLMNMYSDIFGGSETKVLWFLMYYAFSLPRQLANTVPVASAVSVLLVYTMKARTNELLAYMVGGISPLRLARPLLVVTLILSGLTYATTEFLANKGDAQAERIKRVFIEERSEESLTKESKLFQKGQSDRFYMIRSFQPSQNRMDFPYIFELYPGWKSIKWSLEAKSAEFVEAEGSETEETEARDKGQWRFDDAILREYSEDGQVTTYRSFASGLETEILPNGSRLESELARYIKQRWRPSQMTAMELLDYIELFQLQNKPTYELKTHLHFNIATALGCFVLTCLMIGHILRPASAGVLVGFGGGLILIAVYYVAFLFARDASMVGTIPAILGAQGPNVLFLMVALFMLNRNRTV
ncbi:LptF/LptG family permease [bacterium]|nr:LptF/LptG family permease [bacterium]